MSPIPERIFLEKTLVIAPLYFCFQSMIPVRYEMGLEMVANTRIEK